MLRKHQVRIVNGRRPSVVATIESDPRQHLSFFGFDPREMDVFYKRLEPVMVRQAYRKSRIRTKRRYGAGRITNAR